MKTLIAIFLSGIIQLGIAQNDTCLNFTELGLSFPPVSDSLQRTFTDIHMNELGVKKIRFAEEWAYREPVQGIFQWNSLDNRINWAENNGYEILLTIQSNGPTWACSPLQNSQSCVFNDNNDFKIYMDTLMKRYSGKISKIQFGNEWQTEFWYIGNANNFIQANNILYQSVKQYSPSTEMVLGGFTTSSLTMLAAINGVITSFYDSNGNIIDSAQIAALTTDSTVLAIYNRIDSVLQYASYDILDLHLYDAVEQWDELYLNFSDTITKPIIVSEFGGPNLNYEPYTEHYQAERLYQYIKKIDSLQITEAYYFKLVEGTNTPYHMASGLIEDTTLVEKEAYYVYKAFHPCLSNLYETRGLRELHIFPNPCSDYINIKSDSQINEVYIYNMNGKLLRKIHYSEYISMESLNSGIYIIGIETENSIDYLQVIKK